MCLLSCFDKYELKHILRENNDKANVLPKLVSSKKWGQHRTFIQETLVTPSIDKSNIFVSQIGSNSWMNPIWNYLVNNQLLEDNIEEKKKIKLKLIHYVIFDGEIFRWGISILLLKCLSDDEAQYVMKKIHRDICGMHSRGRNMATWVLWVGYYWPTMHINREEYSKRCKECQKFDNLHNAPLDKSLNIHSPWPFAF